MMTSRQGSRSRVWLKLRARGLGSGQRARQPSGKAAYWPCCSALALENEAGAWGPGRGQRQGTLRSTGTEGGVETAWVRPWLLCRDLSLSFILWTLGA